MRRVFGVFILIVTIGMVYSLDHYWPAIPALGRLLDPVSGFWANAENTKKSFSDDLKLPALQKDVKLWLDDRLVPHIRAKNDHDVYFMEGYLHAYFRLWQMDMETRAAAGRVSEVVGAKALEYDEYQRRLGMVYAAENSLKAMEADPRTKAMADAYSEGINAYINTLNTSSTPLEYKLMGFAPEPWTNLKTALLLKYMADDLTGYTEDLPLTYLKSALPPEIFDALYPGSIKGSSPVIPTGTMFTKPSLNKPSVPTGNLFPSFPKNAFTGGEADGTGSNNWALSGAKTQSGAAILCNDPHLGLNLPSLWFEVQLQSPGMNVYGASLPGAPGVVIGFNDSVSWGLTNNYRDVKDFYLIKRVAGSKDKYLYDGKELSFDKRIERIKVKGAPDVLDTVNYTVQGPVTYDEEFVPDAGLKQPLAIKWMAHHGTNEILCVYLLNRAANYDQFVEAIMHFECPAQNMIFADRKGNVALWGQGQFVNKWKDQGRYVMDGSTSATNWGELIPMHENPHAYNPPQGYVASANQCVTDSTYPYWYNGYFYEFRAWRINQVLAKTKKATIRDMFALQQDTHSILAENAVPIFLKYSDGLGGGWIEMLKNWDYNLAPNRSEATCFQTWWYFFYNKMWESLGQVPEGLYPSPERTLQLMKADSVFNYTDKENTMHSIAIREAVTASYYQMRDSLQRASLSGNKDALLWYAAKNTSITHLTKLPAFSYNNLNIGGWGNTINAAKGDHGPSWRMVVQMGKEIEAYGVYPGGQSGNPGSKYYGNFIADWAAGQYYRLLFLPADDKQKSKQLMYTITAHP